MGKKKFGIDLNIATADCLKGTPPFRLFWRTAYQKMLKLAGQIDLDE